MGASLLRRDAVGKLRRGSSQAGIGVQAEKNA